ncbi:hypothetical protein ACWA2B_00945 [Paenibacillus sp. CMM36]
MAGSFQTSRDMFANPIWKNIVEFRLFFLIYGKAVFSDEGVRLADDLILKRGEWCRSTRKLQEDLQYIENRQVKTYSTSVINRCIKKLEKSQRICTRIHELGTVFTVVNYEQYQGFGGFKKGNLEHNLEQSGNSVGTVGEQSGNNNKNVKNDMNVKNEIKDIYEFWNSLEIIKHRELTQKMKSSINARLENMTIDEMREAIGNYNTIITSELYWYTYKFTLDKFMNPKNIDQFLSENKPFETFRKQKGGGNGGKSGRYDARHAEASRKDASKNEELFIGKFGHNTIENPEEFDRMLRNFE